MVRMVYFFNSILGMGALGIALIFVALLLNRANGGDEQ
ncbi:hypothetical protein P788_0865 [Enterococcus faecalis MTUP9]|nr:hypothetical protein P788_0865 [Enterococcus faecalis MTUP9]